MNSGSWWSTGRPGTLRFMGSQRVGHDWATELNWLMLGLMVASSKRACAAHRSAAPRAPSSAAGHCWPVPPQETLKGRSGSVFVVSPGVHKVCLSPPSASGGNGVWSYRLAVASPLSLAMGYLFLVGYLFLLSIVVQQWVVSLEFLQEKMSARPSTPPSCKQMWLINNSNLFLPVLEAGSQIAA